MNNQSTTTDIQKKIYLMICLIKATLCCSAWHWVLLNVHRLAAFLIRSKSSLHWRNIFRKKLRLQRCKGILKQVASNREVENLWTTNSCVQLKRLKSFNFGGPRLGELFFIFVSAENFVCLLWVVKKFEIWRSPSRRNLISVPSSFVKLYLSFLFTYL